MKPVPHKIILDLRWGGFKGEDVDEIMPDFVTERRVRCELEWGSTCEGPYSFRIFIEIGLLLALVGKAFLDELGKDMYHWCKTGLGKVFSRKPNADGWTEIRFKDATVQVEAHPSSDEFADVWLELPELITTSDLSRSKHWRVKTDPKTKKRTLESTTKV